MVGVVAGSSKSGPALAALLCWDFDLSWSSVFALEAIVVAAALLVSSALLLPPESPTWKDRLRKLKKSSISPTDQLQCLSSFFTFAVGILAPIMIGRTLRWGSAPRSHLERRPRKVHR